MALQTEAIETDRTFWTEFLGVDYDRLSGEMQDDDTLVGRIARLSRECLAHLLMLAGDPAASEAAASARMLAGRLLESSSGRSLARRTLLLSEYLLGRRIEGLREASAALQREGRERAAVFADERETHLVQALDVAAHQPGLLIYYALYDRAARVRFTEFRLAGGPGRGILALADALTDMDRDAVEAVLGRQEAEGECLGAASGRSPSTRDVFVLLPGAVETVRTLDGVERLRRGRWLILRFRDGGERLWVHGAGELGARVAEALVNEATGEDGLRYLPYLPLTEAEEVARWSRGLRTGFGADVTTFAVSLRFAGRPRVRWRIEGDVREGLALLEASLGADAPVEILEADLGFMNAAEKGAGASSGGAGSPQFARFRLTFDRDRDPGAVLVRCRAISSDAATRRRFVAWMESRGIRCAPS